MMAGSPQQPPTIMPHLEHVGIAVEDPDAAARLYEALLDVRPYKHERVDHEGVQTHFLAAGHAKLELLEALGPDSPVARFLEKRGEGLHHLAFEVDDIHAHMQHLRERGFTPLTDEPRPGADGKLIFFLHPKQTHGVLVEFCQSAPTPWPPTAIPYRDEHLAVYERGSAERPALVVLHGLGGATMLETEPLVRHLEPHFHVLAFDFAGHGGSASYDDDVLSIDFLADNIRGVLDYFDLESAHLFGFSIGGFVALRFALLHRHRAGRVAVHGANVDWNDQLADVMNARLDAEMLESRYPAIAQRLDQFHGNWRRLFARVNRMILGLPAHRQTQHALHRIDHPVLVSAVDRDDLLPLGVPFSLHRALPNSTLAILPGTRHAFRDLDPALYARLLVPYFNAG